MATENKKRVRKPMTAEQKVALALYNKAYRERNKELLQAKRKAHYEANKEQYAKNNKDWRNSHKEERKQYMEKWHNANPEKNKEYCAKRKIERNDEVLAYSRTWKKNNKPKVNASIKARKLAKIQRTVAWSDKEKIESYYSVCAFFNEVNGYIKYHVDHIYPLKGKRVSGLHVENNLQILLAKENIKKSNGFEIL